MNQLTEWATAWGIPSQAMADLYNRMQMDGSVRTTYRGGDASEARVSSLLRLEAAEKDVLLTRNNVGALQDDEGRWVRYGLFNSSKAENEVTKSSDFIGIRRVVIKPQHVGRTIGQFVARECKEGGWSYTGKGREVAQLHFLMMVQSHGGDASFVTGPGTL